MTNERKKYEGKRAVLLRCAYPYGKSQTWLPNDLNKVGAKLDAIGIKTDVVDLNLENMPTNLREYDYIGVGVVGATYVPGTIQLARTVRELTGKKPLIGGPGVEYFSPQEFEKLYGDSVQIRNDNDLSVAIGRQTPPVFDVSINRRLNEINPKLLEKQSMYKDALDLAKRLLPKPIPGLVTVETYSSLENKLN